MSDTHFLVIYTLLISYSIFKGIDKW